MAITINGTSGVTFPDGSLQAAAPPIGSQLQSVIFASTGTWTAPTGVTKVFVQVVSGGAGSVWNSTAAIGTSGTRGTFAYGFYTVVAGTAYTVTVGAGANGASASGALVSSTGGTSSFGSFLTVTGAFTSVDSAGTIVSTSGTPTGSTLTSVGGSSNLNNLFQSGTTRLNGAGSTGVAWSVGLGLVPGTNAQGSGGATVTGGVGGAVFIQYVG